MASLFNYFNNIGIHFKFTSYAACLDWQEKFYLSQSSKHDFLQGADI